MANGTARREWPSHRPRCWRVRDAAQPQILDSGQFRWVIASPWQDFRKCDGTAARRARGPPPFQLSTPPLTPVRAASADGDPRRPRPSRRRLAINRSSTTWSEALYRRWRRRRRSAYERDRGAPAYSVPMRGADPGRIVGGDHRRRFMPQTADRHAQRRVLRVVVRDRRGSGSADPGRSRCLTGANLLSARPWRRPTAWRTGARLTGSPASWSCVTHTVSYDTS